MNQGLLQQLSIAEGALSELRRLLETAGGPEVPQPPPGAPAHASETSLRDPAAFFNALRSGKALGPSLSTDEVSGCEAILKACAGFPVAWAAYCLATPVVETAGTMQPIKEHGGAAYFTRMYDITGDRPEKARELGNLSPGDGALYCGRGYVQVTGKANYARAGLKLNLALVEQPDLALQPDIAAQIMREGMKDGWFTGKSLASYIPAVGDIHQFANARRVINGTDRNVEIAQYALEFQSALQAGGWPT